MLFIDFSMISSRACSRVIAGALVGRVPCMEERGVWAGVEAAEAVLFLLDLKKGMVVIVMI